MLLVFLLYITCAVTFTLGKETLNYTQPIFYVGIRMIFAGLLLLGIFRFIQKNKFQVKREDKYLFLQIAFFSIFLAYVLDLWSLQYITSIESSLVFSISPFMAALFSYFIFNEKMTSKKWLGFLFGFFSIVVLLSNFTSDGSFFASARAVPIFALIISVVSSTYGWIVMRKLVKDRGYSPIFVNGFGMLAGGLGALLTSFVVETWIPSPVISWREFIIFTIAMVIVANIIFSNLYSYLLKRYTATLLSFAGFTCTFFTGILGWIFLGEFVGFRMIISFILVSIGIYIFYQEELRQGYVGR